MSLISLISRMRPCCKSIPSFLPSGGLGRMSGAYKLTCTSTTASLGRSPYQPVDDITPLYVVTV